MIQQQIHFAVTLFCAVLLPVLLCSSSPCTVHAQPLPFVQSLVLVNTVTRQPLGPVGNGTEINLAVAGNQLSIEAIIGPDNSNNGNTRLLSMIRSVVFHFNGRRVRVERSAPFTLGGNNNAMNAYYSVPALGIPGPHTLTAKLILKRRWKASGNSASRSVSFAVVNATREIDRPPSFPVAVAPIVAPSAPQIPPLASPPLAPTTVAARLSKCGGAVNTGGTARDTCARDLWNPTTDPTLHCFAYGGPSDPCSLNNNNDANHGLDKNPSRCDGNTFYLWDEVSSKSRPERNHSFNVYRCPCLSRENESSFVTAGYTGEKLLVGRSGMVQIRQPVFGGNSSAARQWRDIHVAPPEGRQFRGDCRAAASLLRGVRGSVPQQ